MKTPLKQVRLGTFRLPRVMVDALRNIEADAAVATWRAESCPDNLWDIGAILELTHRLIHLLHRNGASDEAIASVAASTAEQVRNIRNRAELGITD